MTGIAAPEVRIAAGRLRGSWENGLAVFRGIRYAEPPVGPLRFAAPHAAREWTGVREALAFGPAAPQSDVLGTGLPPARDEDWLTVNVWSPAVEAGAALPVMVWIYGGGYALGSADRPEYHGGRLASDGRVVLVTFNYRLGVEGFAGIEGAPANRGLLDQVAALEWVRDNIAAFGGDPGRVTVFGESAGGGSVAALLAMPRAAGLFRRAIAQSVPGPFLSSALAGDIGAAIAAELGLRATVDDLAGVEPALLTAAGDAVAAGIASRSGRWGTAAHGSILFAPVVDGEVLPVTPWRALADGAGRGVDLLAGHTRDEHRLFTFLGGVLGRVTPEQAATAGQPAMLLGSPPGAGAAELSAQMRSAWTRFAADGDPGWAGYDTARRLTRVFDEAAVVVPYPEEASRVLWRGHSFDPLPLLDA
ncbi:carboxylesterase/lipase family protein [Actinoplanes philippinensis]|uniref:carboxylesterase/lipase family protein n=1 Tax=Actinoplanes philippinensis TaxID=35752 RepID=UPI0033CD54EC